MKLIKLDMSSYATLHQKTHNFESLAKLNIQNEIVK